MAWRLLQLLYCYVYGPEVYYFYGTADQRGKRYHMPIPERLGGYMYSLLHCWPLVLIVLGHQCGWRRSGSLWAAMKCSVTTFLKGYLLALGLRVAGRLWNKEYYTFALVWREKGWGQSSPGPGTANNSFDLSLYDRPLPFRNCNFKCTVAAKSVTQRAVIKADSVGQAVMYTLFAWPMVVLLGPRLVYPGSTFVVRLLMPDLVDYRAGLIEQLKARQIRVDTADGIGIDGVFYDRRGRANNSILPYELVITCEGNASFYEMSMGNMLLPMGSSVLAWNHPGFGESQGSPSPNTDANSLVAVISYACQVLHFDIANILVFSWSIGCYAATRAAAHFPELGGLVLDAPFDSLAPLARQRMPKFMGGLVDYALGRYYNLSTVDGLRQYNGPVRIMRRTNDEMICTTHRMLGTNRGNYLVAELLCTRYPNLVSRDDVLSCMCVPLGSIPYEDPDWQNLLQVLQHQPLPCLYGEGLDAAKKKKYSYFLVLLHTTDVPLRHCELWPISTFQLPWSIARHSPGHTPRL